MLISQIQFFSKGIKDVMSPHFPPVHENIMDQFLEVLESSFTSIQTEEKLLSVLGELDLIEPLEKYQLLKIQDKYEQKPQRKRRKPVEGSDNTFVADGILRKTRKIEINDSDESGDSDYIDDDEDIEETDCAEVETKNIEEEIIKGMIVKLANIISYNTMRLNNFLSTIENSSTVFLQIQLNWNY